jgi:hypothetical protein
MLAGSSISFPGKLDPRVIPRDGVCVRGFAARDPPTAEAISGTLLRPDDAIPDSILKPGRLDADEWEIMKTHHEGADTSSGWASIPAPTTP